MRRPLLPAVSSIVLLSCAGEPPTVVKGDSSFVTVTQPKHTRKSAVKEVAQSYCDQYGKHAVMLSSICPDATCPEQELTFWCR
jgi:hypothetical protein